MISAGSWWVVLLLVSITPSMPGSLDKDPDLDTLAAWMSGDFDTFEQVASDEKQKTPYSHVGAVLHIRRVEIPGLVAAGTGKTLYFEQAMAGQEEEPYRQGVYLLTRENQVLVNRGYRISNPSEFVGAWKQPELLKGLTADRLKPILGCEAILTRLTPERYTGIAGLNGTCPSSVRGATYMVSHSEITPTYQLTLDQGFDDDGNHKWGPPPGTIGHMFRKKS
jgi:CpeT protein